MMPTWKYDVSHTFVFFVQALHIYTKIQEWLGRIPTSKHKKLRTSRLSHSAHVPDPGQMRNGYGRARGVKAAPLKRRSNEAI